MKTSSAQVSFDFDDPPAAPPVRHTADKEPPVAAERLSVAENPPSADVRVAPVFDWLADYIGGTK